MAEKIERAGVNRVELLVEVKKGQSFFSIIWYTLLSMLILNSRTSQLLRFRKEVIEEIVAEGGSEDELRDRIWARVDDLAPSISLRTICLLL